MKKSIILLAGYPGTGKSYLMDMIQNEFKAFQILSPDNYKEMMWDKYGFDSMKEKDDCIQKAWDAYYEDMHNNMKKGIHMLSDYPFSDKQKERIQGIADTYDYQIITIRLIANLDVLYERQRKRDLDRTRHLGHIVGSYHKGMSLDKRDDQPCMVAYDEFINRCKNRGYGDFVLGNFIKEIDVTDFHKVDYSDLMRELKLVLEND